MSILTIGRVGTDVDVDGVKSQEFSDGRMSLSIEVYSGVADALAMRQQILGYVDSTDEPVVPVTWSVEPAIDGYYRITDVRVSTRGTGPSTISNVHVDLERVQGYSAPLIEIRNYGALRVNTHSITVAQVYQSICMPDAAASTAFISTNPDAYIPFIPSVIRTGATGAVKVFDLNASSPFISQYYCAPASYYNGAATLYTGSTYRIRTGRQIQNDPVLWRVGNGLFEIEGVAGTDFTMRFRAYYDGAWTSYTSFTMVTNASGGARGPLPAPHTITVLRNSPEEVVIRLLTASNSSLGSAYSPVTVDISLKRGQRFFSAYLASVFVGSFAMRCTAFAAATVDDPFTRWKTIGTSRMVFSAPQVTGQTGDDVFPNQSAVQTVTSWAFMIGLVKGADVTDTLGRAIAEYFYAGSPKQVVVAQ